MIRFPIAVTAEDIEKATPGTTSCPIAQAALRIFGRRLADVEVSDAIYLFPADEPPLVDLICTVDLPDEAVDLMSRFDGDLTIEPTTFTVELNDELAEALGVGDVPFVVPGQLALELVA